MTGDRDRFVWTPEQVEVTPPDRLACEGCRAKLTGDEAIPGLCSECADTIDRDTEARLEREHFGGDLG